MPTVCIQRPNRTKPRHFTPRDLERIARTMEEQGNPAVTIIVTVLVATGTIFLVCKLSKAIDDVLGILGLVKQIAAVLATAGAVNALIIWLSRVKGIPIPIVTTVIGWVIVFLLAINALAKGAAGLISDIETIEDGAAFLAGLCEAASDKLTGG